MKIAASALILQGLPRCAVILFSVYHGDNNQDTPFSPAHTKGFTLSSARKLPFYATVSPVPDKDCPYPAHTKSKCSSNNTNPDLTSIKSLLRPSSRSKHFPGHVHRQWPLLFIPSGTWVQCSNAAWRRQYWSRDHKVNNQLKSLPWVMLNKDVVIKKLAQAVARWLCFMEGLDISHIPTRTISLPHLNESHRLPLSWLEKWSSCQRKLPGNLAQIISSGRTMVQAT